MRYQAGKLSNGLNRLVEAVVGALMAVLVLDVWIGVMDRYLFHWQLPWPEVLARYLMIWVALLAISSGIARRQHIGMTAVLGRTPPRVRRVIGVVSDFLAAMLFAYLLWFGVDFAIGGASRQAMIFGMSLTLPFAAVPTASALCLLQIILVALRDSGSTGGD
ncbi:TRAP transporter small permease [Ruegeria sp.]|uniref:TRAP transporter small permease n=1 Tax=Ruegeria sp. TaxID=1879320 RepID=UPI0023199149|nr:TRAP transporter small permease [Ruegeria sp.]MDA7963658.1 TRAP transporter small permease [Ruegeria sp.]